MKIEDEIIKQIYRKWIAYFGFPRQLLTNNGGKFLNEYSANEQKNLVWKQEQQQEKTQ